MMREILFRGKAVGSLKWVDGFYFREAGNFIKELPSAVSTETHMVYEDTVGQYTGLTDKNGKKVFEGDILSIAQIKDGIGGCISLPLKYPVNVVVKWDMCAWSWETLCKDKRYISFPNAWCHFECEVIGNIHDNPELLKGGER